MARVARLAGALIAETHGTYFLVGNTKRPCDFAALGFASPPSIDALAKPFISLNALGSIEFEPPWLVLDVEGEALAKLLFERFVILRNGSVSDRLWRLVTGQRDDDLEIATEVDAHWLASTPKAVWDVVRESVLRCT